jgi:hypothetical protein
MAKTKRKAIPSSEKSLSRTQPARAMAESEPEKTDSKIFVPIAKASVEEQTVTGVVLQPEVTDAQGDIYSSDVIRKAAHKFLSNYNKATKLGLQHKNFKKQFDLVESYTAPQSLILNGKTIKQGAWIMTVKVLDSKIWEKVKKGEITGFSIGGKAKVRKLTPQ